MAWCGCSRKGRQCLASSGGGAAGWSVSTSTPYIPWQRRSNKALQPFSGGVYGWVFCAKNWQMVGIVLPKLQTPLADGLMGHVDAALEQEFLYIAVAQREAIIQPDAMANDLPREAMVLVAFGVSGWRHIWLPMGVCEWFVRVHHWSEYLTGQEARSTT